jgi:Ca2+-binding RTX toxin-like protein
MHAARILGNVRISAGLAAWILVATALAIAVALFSDGPRPAQAAAPVGQGFTITPSDLKFILKQIKIAENHATRESPGGLGNPPAGTPMAGQPLFGQGPNQIASPLLPFGLRTVDGSYNNGVPGQSTFGAAHQPFPRMAARTFLPGENSDFGLGPVGAPGPTHYSQKKGNVVDSKPRVVSNLIVDQSSDNPSAVKAAGRPHRHFNPEPSAIPCDEHGQPSGCVEPGETLFIPNVTTDVGLSPPFNGLFTIFGQFFDHGLDSTVKAGAQVFVPLKSDDPLIPGKDRVLGDDPDTLDKDESTDDLAPSRRFMVITRSKNLPGPDGRVGDNPATVGVDESQDDIQDATNTDTPWVDQNQTYTSHPSHQVFLRAYANNPSGKPVSTGKLIEGDVGGMATWADVKQQARDLLGIRLVDADALAIPMVAADEYGRFLRGPAHGLPQIVTDSGLIEGDPTTPIVVPTSTKRLDVAFLDDIGHHAVPKSGLSPDADTSITPVNAQQPSGTYDDEMLDRHFIAGDGRVNENIALTAVHQVFHSEHNRLNVQIKDVLEDDDSAEGLEQLQEWKLASGAGGWNGERLFQAARFITEMEYQHLVFEEFARKVQPLINPFNVFTQSDTGINPAIRAEFAHAVYRFGHSMLTDTVDRKDADGTENSLSLLDAFLNPPAYYDGPGSTTLTPDEAAGTIAMGMTDQVGNEIDEFVTSTLRNNLLGLPLDLPAVNMTRARETGVPSLNNFRKDLYQQTNESSLQPYSSWVDYGLGLKHQDSVVNYMAAYGKHPSIASETLLRDKRRAAQIIYDNDISLTPETPLDAEDFVNSAGDWANTPEGVSRTGVDDIDLWVGGLAESQNLFGGLLGSTFNYVFENQLTDLQDGDRLYYLSRTSGMNLRTSLEGNSFAELVMRNTSAEAIKADPFSTADCEFELDHPEFSATTGNHIDDDPTSECDESQVLIRMADGTIRYRQTNSVDPPGINAQNTFNGTSGNDRIWGGVDSDTFWGNDGNDRIEGSDGGDVALGGEGRDVITDSAGDDILKGGPGNDAIDSGVGLDVIMAGDGDDLMNGGLNDNDTFAGEGNDFVISGEGADTVFGGGGDDWQEGGNGNDLLQGDSGAPFFDDINKPGHDVLIGGSNEDDYDSEGGDDIQVAGAGIERNHGARGYDWVTHARYGQPGETDLNIHIDPPSPGQLADRFLLTEAVSGWDHNDLMRGDDWTSWEQDVEIHGPWGSNVLTDEGIDRIAGLRPLLAGHTECRTDPQTPGDEGEGGPPASGPPITLCGFGEGNILLGGGGSDTIQGRGSDDIIDGDRWLNHRLSVRTNPADPGTETRSANSLAELQPAVFAGTLDPGNIVIVREILSDGPAGIDTAVYAGAREDYDIDNQGTTLVVTHARNLLPCCADQNNVPKGDGTDTLRNIERLRFSNATVEVADVPTNTPPTGTVTLSTTTPAENQQVTATRAFTDLDGVNESSLVYTWMAGSTPVATGLTYTPGDAAVGLPLQVVVTYVDGDGQPESVSSAVTAAVTNVNDPPSGAVTVSDATPQETQALTANASSVADDDGLSGVQMSYQWQQSGLNGAGAFANIANVPAGYSTGATFIPGQAQVNRALRVIVSYTDNHGTAESVTSAATGVTGDLFVGTDAANTWTGTAGDDVARGAGGNDTLNAAGGNDLVSGDGGDDTINVSTGNDVMEFSGAGDGFDAVTGGAGTDAIQAAASATTVGLRSLATGANATELVTDNGFGPVVILGDGAANTLNFSATTLTNVSRIDGAGGSDVLTGSAGADVMRGGPGVDTIAPGLGANTVSGDAGDDTITGNGGNDVIEVSGTGDGFDAVTGGGGTDQVRAMSAGTEIGLRSLAGGANATEQITANGHGGVHIAGDAAANTLSFSATTLTGIVDIDGRGGVDTLTGSAGPDVFLAGAGDDTIAGGPGNDRVEVTGSAGGFDSVNGGPGDDEIRAMANDTVIGLRALPTGANATEDITAGGHTGVRIRGDGAANVLNLSAVALSGIVDIDGGAGTDTLTGSGASDVITGGADNDSLNGGPSGNEVYRFEAGFGGDTVTGTGAAGFDANATGGQDKLDVSALGITAGTFASQVTVGAAPAGGTLVTIGPSSVRLAGVADPATVTASDFVLAP